MITNRIRIAAMLMSVLLLLYLIRLGWIDLLPHRNASGTPSSVPGHGTGTLQLHSSSLLLDSGRGDFLDRKGRSITGISYKGVALFPAGAQKRGSGRDLAVLARIMGLGREELELKLRQLKEPQFWNDSRGGQPHRLTSSELKQLADLRIEGVAVLPYHARYNQKEAGIQAIGYISENPARLHRLYGQGQDHGPVVNSAHIGGAGLELSLERLLQGQGSTYARYFTDASGLPLKGLDMTLTRPSASLYPLQVVTTLSMPLQRRLASYAAQEGLKAGAIVVLDARNADVLAMVSMPLFDPLKLKETLEGSENRAVLAYTPGSIYKIVTEAAALEAGVANEKESFYCGGEYGRYGLSCWKEGGHGKLSLREGLAQSCNIVFAGLAERLLPGQLEQTADKLGLGKRVGWSLPQGQTAGPLTGPLRLLWEEESGQVFRSGGQPDGGELARSGIGQQDVLVSPLQAANLMVTLLHGGRAAEPRLVSEILYADGERLARLPARELKSPYGRISPSTASAIRKGLEMVVQSGTGRSLKNGSWRLAGKSGTAQTGRGNHQWFVGYGPADHPRYAVAVLAESRPRDSANQAVRLFGGVMERVAAWEAEELAGR